MPNFHNFEFAYPERIVQVAITFCDPSPCDLTHRTKLSLLVIPLYMALIKAMVYPFRLVVILFYSNEPFHSI